MGMSIAITAAHWDRRGHPTVTALQETSVQANVLCRDNCGGQEIPSLCACKLVLGYPMEMVYGACREAASSFDVCTAWARCPGQI